MRKIINEGLDHKDFVGQILPIVGVDEYEAKSGDDDQIITFSFIVKGKAMGEDLCDWLIKGYDFISDCEVSEGELSANRFVVFVETNRRSKAPERLLEILDDLETLTDIPLENWKIKIDDVEYEPNLETLKQNMVTIPVEYCKEHDEESDDLNEMRNIAGLSNVNVYKEKDSILKDFIAKAGL